MNERMYYGKHRLSGDNHWRAYVGPPLRYDLMGAMQFNLLTHLGLRETHNLLDIGCGSLRAGRLLITYLFPNRYCGVEPNKWLVQSGIREEIGGDMERIKKPLFQYRDDFNFQLFGRKFNFILAQSIFSHTSQEQLLLCMKNAKEVMAPDAIFAATYKHGEEDYQGKEWHYPDTIRYTPETIKRVAGDAGLSCTLIDWPHPHSQDWIVLTLPAKKFHWIPLTA